MYRVALACLFLVACSDGVATEEASDPDSPVAAPATALVKPPEFDANPACDYDCQWPIRIDVQEDLPEDCKIDLYAAMGRINNLAGRTIVALSADATVHVVFGELPADAGAWTHTRSNGYDVDVTSSLTEWQGYYFQGLGEAMYFHELMHVLDYTSVTGDVHDDGVMSATRIESYAIEPRHVAYLQYLGALNQP